MFAINRLISWEAMFFSLFGITQLFQGPVVPTRFSQTVLSMIEDQDQKDLPPLRMRVVLNLAPVLNKTGEPQKANPKEVSWL